MIGSRALVDHVADAGLRIVNQTEFASRADLVVVADHERFDYAELRIATQAVLRGAELIGLTRDRTFPMPDGPGPGPARSSRRSRPRPGRKAGAIVGKPEPAMYEAARDRLGRHDPRRRRPPRRRHRGAKRAGLDSALVLTGGTEPRRGRRRPARPHAVAESLAALLLTS